MTVKLTLPNDNAVNGPDLVTHLSTVLAGDDSKQELIKLFDCIANASISIGKRLAYGKLPGDPAKVVGTNNSGDKQKSLDVAAHQHVISQLSNCSVRSVLSEEAESVISMSSSGRFDLAIDPIDGSGSIGIGAPLGLLFAIFPAGDTFLRSGRSIIAAGYVSFGHSVDFGFSVGQGVTLATLDTIAERYVITEEKVILPKQTSMIAFNASNMRHWAPGVQCYVQDLLVGKQGPREKDFNMRWLAAAVGELHRIMNQGGVFMYPSDARPGFEDGHIRLVYEGFPIAWLIEQAGGKATDGRIDILDKVPVDVHEKTPLLFGSDREIDNLLSYLQ